MTMSVLLLELRELLEPRELLTECLDMAEALHLGKLLQHRLRGLQRTLMRSLHDQVHLCTPEDGQADRQPCRNPSRACFFEDRLDRGSQ